jgi:hypothetical protein
MIKHYVVLLLCIVLAYAEVFIGQDDGVDYGRGEIPQNNYAAFSEAQVRSSMPTEEPDFNAQPPPEFPSYRSQSPKQRSRRTKAKSSKGRREKRYDGKPSNNRYYGAREQRRYGKTKSKANGYRTRRYQNERQRPLKRTSSSLRSRL